MIDKYSIRYGFKDSKELQDFHRSRRMFVVDAGEVILAEPDLPYSHALWFDKDLKWDKQKHERVMNDGLRGIIYEDGNVAFYTGYDFNLNDRIEEEFFEIFTELAEKAKLKQEAQVIGGLKKGKPGTDWSPQKVYGKAEDLI